ncbi:MAG: hypothetical protein WBE65_01035 [Steroidobacteraceae bacterium]
MVAHKELTAMQAPPALADTATLRLPPDLLAAARRLDKDRTPDFKVEGWKPTLLERIARLFGRG